MGNGREHYETSIGFGYSRFTLHRGETVLSMWDAVRNQREKKSRMVTVDMRRKLQSEKCTEQGDVRAHLVKLQIMWED